MSASRLTPTIRVRLTVLYGLSFVLAGTLLVAIEYLLVRSQLQPPTGLGEVVAGPNDVPLDAVLTHQRLPMEDRIVVGNVERFVAQSLSTLLWKSVLVLAVAVLLAIVLGWVLAGRALAPLQTVTSTARRVSARGLHERIALRGPHDEVKALADTFDAMLERLDRAFDAQRHFVGNASHELRTPLAVTRTLLEVASADPAASEDLRRLAAPLLATNERSERLIEGLLLLARSEQKLTSPVRLDLADLVEGVVEQTRAEAAACGIDLRCCAVRTPVAGEPVLLERLVGNLVQNAVRHNSRGGWAEVRVLPAGDSVVVTVANSGPPVERYETAVMFEPFRRLGGRVATATAGSGLGLSIVRAVAQAHGGNVIAVPRDGGGVVVTVTLPAAPVENAAAVLAPAGAL